jgi:type I restriction enzyme M protein
MFEKVFKNIDTILKNDGGSSTELDYTEQTSWILFLKYLDALEQDKALAADLAGKPYEYILEEPYRWESWAAPKNDKGEIDHNIAMTGDDLKQFVNQNLFPYLMSFKQKATSPNTIEYKIGEIFSEIVCRLVHGYNLRKILDLIDTLKFRSQTEKHELSHLYETKIKNMGNAGRNGGEYYTPRPLIRAMIKVTNPKIGETVYDAAVGSAGFLCETYEYLIANQNLSIADHRKLQESTFYGKEKKPLAYVIAIMNMILHGIEAPNIVHTNTLTENLADIQEKDRHNIILANPPFGGGEDKQVQQNFPIKTGETASLFMQHFIKMLKAGGRAAIVIKNTFLSNSEHSDIALRKLLLETCNLHTVMDCPQGTFQGAGVKTVVLFFTKGEPTKNIWYYKLKPGRNLGKTKPLNDKDLLDFIDKQDKFIISDNSWVVDIKNVDPSTYDLSVKNPNGEDDLVIRPHGTILKELTALQEKTSFKFNIRSLIPEKTPIKKLGDVCTVIAGQSPEGRFYNDQGNGMPFYQGKKEYGDRYLKDPTVWTTEITKIAFPEDILISVRAPVGALNITPQEVCIGRGLAAIRPKSEVLRDYVYLHLQHIQDSIVGNEGAVFNSLNKGQIEAIEIPVPSLQSQEKIIKDLNTSLDEIKKAIDDSAKTIELLEELKKSALLVAFNRE